MRYLQTMISCVFMLILISNGYADEFKLRESYPDVMVLELNELKAGYDNGDFLIVDVRSKAEFETIHIKNAVNIPYGNAKFTITFQRTAKHNPTPKIAVYGNGKNSLKPYKAADDAFSFASIPNVYAFDSGITAWASAYPGETLLFGKKLEEPEKQLISEDQFHKQTLDYDSFIAKAIGPNSMVFDLRDPIQRKTELPGIRRIYHISMEKLIDNIVSKGHLKDKELFVFDQVGGKVKWLMYYLNKNNYSNFYFLDGGATAVLEKQEYRIVSSY